MDKLSDVHLDLKYYPEEKNFMSVALKWFGWRENKTGRNGIESWSELIWGLSHLLMFAHFGACGLI